MGSSPPPQWDLPLSGGVPSLGRWRRQTAGKHYSSSGVVTAAGCDVVAVHMLMDVCSWGCRIGVQAGPDLPAGGRCLCWLCIMNKNNSKWAFGLLGFKTTRLLVASLCTMEAGCQTGLEEQHLPWGKRRVVVVCKCGVMGSCAGSAVTAAMQNSLCSL